ncbi:SDR family NAD(P)-dependent oxidoreductase [Vibrio parahaemolyticus]|nr:SDR family NAD(P)-dependent oxidoreductase [Vibrio parahaemolyticus]HBC3451401.1 SDR family oxidoreductase [Vibrio parahaemolyticus]
MIFKKLLRGVSSSVRGLLFLLKNGGSTYAKISLIEYGGILEGKTILVTGGSSGIGLSIAKKALSEKANVIVTGRSIKKLEELKLTINCERFKTMQWDVSNIQDIEANLQEAIKLFGNIDIIINNAGVLLEQKFPFVSESSWDDTYKVNSKAVFFLCQSMSKIWIEKKSKGKIINVSSTSGFYGTVIPYGMTKWDIVGLTEGLAKRLIKEGIVVNGIAPGRTATDMLGRESEGNIYDQNTLPKRFALPEEISELALFLMSDASNFIVGQTIICDGGYSLEL